METIRNTNIEKNLAFVRKNMLELTSNMGLKSDSVTLVAVSKRFGIPNIEEAMRYGQLDFGENRVQEFRDKTQKIDSNIKWHFIGHLQTNKVKYVLDKTHLLHSLDRIDLAREIDRQCKNKETTMDALIQVNISKEGTKSGIFSEEINEFIDDLSKLENVKIKGLMTMAPFTDNEYILRKTFSGLRNIYDKLVGSDLPSNIEMRYISMGMSNDYKEAIKEGSNMIRVGSAIFGARM